jgi:peptidoglycan/LPS O-acetylase OafA/YrhL
MVVLGLYAFVFRTVTVSVPAFTLYALTAVLCTFALAYALYIFVERPARSAGKRLAARLERRAPRGVKATA